VRTLIKRIEGLVTASQMPAASAASFFCLRGEESQHLLAPERFGNDHAPTSVNAMNLKKKHAWPDQGQLS
jgi:hypothetical protein